MKSKVAILTELNKPLVVDDVEIPKLECGQVLVEIYKSGICGAQIGEITGAKGEDKFLPHLLGHEGAGIVLDVGVGVKHVKEGDHVVAHWRKGQGIDAPFPKYKWGDKTVGGGQVTTFAERAIISENRLTVIDKDYPFEYGALMGCAITTAFGLINNEAQLKIGQSILILGCGGVGLSIIKAAKLVGAGRIMAVDLTDEKMAEAIKMGADVTATSADFFEEADVVVDTTGKPQAIADGWNITREKMILVGQPHRDEVFNFQMPRDTFYSGKVMMDSQGGLTDPNVDIPRYLDMFRHNKVDYKDLISHEFKLDDINEAMDMVKSGKGRRCMLNTL